MKVNQTMDPKWRSVRQVDDLVASIAASAASRIAHRMRDLEEEGETFADIPPVILGPQTKPKRDI